MMKYASLVLGVGLTARCLSRKVVLPIAAVCAGLLLPVAVETTARASTGAWVKGHAHKSRLISGLVPTRNGIATYAAVEIALKPGWKTYWHNPGNAGGIPPQFDFSRSRNVALVDVRYPAPKRMVDETGTTFGYKDAVTFPVRVVPSDPNRPVELNLQFNFGVCEQICIPAFAEHTLKIGTAATGTTPV
ncbi:MAG: protein-disulfide reductase DsbD domain-containing protein, partial [Pseudomonadota bacterium]